MRTVGLIGPMGAGKSVVARALASCGAEVIRADEVSRELLQPGSAVLATVAAAFGEGVLDDEGALKRRELGGIVFADEAARRELEEIVHPAMVASIAARLAELGERQSPPRLAVIEAANLVEMGGAALADVLVVVTAPREERLRRVMARDGLSRDEAEARVRTQEAMGIGEHPADHVIVTEGAEASTRAQAERLWYELVEGNDWRVVDPGK